MFGDGSLTFQEFVTNEPLPLATIHDAVFEFLRRRTDIVLIGAHGVNAYVDEPRMSQAVDVASTRAADLANEIRDALAAQFHIAVRVREVADGQGYRLYQLRKPKNRHLVDVRQVAELPPTKLVAEVRVAAPEELIAQKVISCTQRGAQPKGLTDQRDLMVLLLAHPKLKSESGAVMERLRAAGADAQAISEWRRLAKMVIEDDGE